MPDFFSFFFFWLAKLPRPQIAPKPQRLRESEKYTNVCEKHQKEKNKSSEMGNFARTQERLKEQTAADLKKSEA